MISLTTAKLLLLIALAIGPKCPHGSHSIEVVTKDAYCVWEENSGKWSLTQLNGTTAHWPFNGGNTDIRTFEPSTTSKVNPAVIDEISRHDWSQDAILTFPNGDIVEKQENKIYYTVNAGAANQQVYTILSISHGKTL